MKHLEKLSRKALSEVIVDEGLISKAQLAEILEEHEATKRPLGSILVAANFLSEWDLAKAVCSQYQLPYFDLKTYKPTKAVMELIEPGEMKAGTLLPIDEFGTVVTLAVSELPEMSVLRGIRERTGLIPFLYVSLLSEIRAAYERATGVKVQAEKPKPEIVVTEPSGEMEHDDALSALDHVLAESTDEKEPYEIDEKSILAGADGGGDWSELFDMANESVLKEIDRD